MPFAADLAAASVVDADCPHDAESCTTAPTPVHLRSIGLSITSVLGMGGTLGNASPETVMSLVFTVQPGIGLRWYPQIGWENLNGANGVRLDLLRFGVPFRVGPVRPLVVEIEPIVGVPIDYLGTQVFIEVAAMVGVRVHYKNFYFLGVPAGVEARFFDALTQSGAGGMVLGAGFGWTLMVEAGVRL